MLEQLPTAVMSRVVSALDIPSRCKLAGCNSLLQKRVFTDELSWTVLNFWNLNRSTRERLSDLDLSRILIRVNGKQNLKELNLQGCRNIRGSGLAPLKHSQVLESINLSATAAQSNPMPFLQTLQTMIPYKFFHLDLSKSVMKNPNHMLLEFFRILRQTKLEQTLHDQTLCNSCQDQVMEESRQLVPCKNGMPCMKCLKCKQDFCCKGSCPMGVLECHSCGNSYCDACSAGFIASCSTCGCACCFLDPCGGMAQCHECNKYWCEDCYKQHGILCKCQLCNGPNVCNDCGTQRGICAENCILCKTCRTLGRCSECKTFFCGKCHLHMSCEKCGNVFCGKSECLDKVAKCSACKETLCVKCGDFEHCSGCNISYCTEHGRMVDCASCKMRHCRSCKHVTRCKLCGLACFEEECTCSGETAAKRARVS